MLTGKQKRYLRGLGHGLKPVLLIGKNEINAALTAEADAALASHELIKVKILESCEMDRHEVAASLAKASGAELAQVLGRTLLLYRKGDESKIELPSGSGNK
jgi:RNA-binding protein